MMEHFESASASFLTFNHTMLSFFLHTDVPHRLKMIYIRLKMNMKATSDVAFIFDLIDVAGIQCKPE